ncbi:hypothetical protein [Coxiella burnetii]|uniref:Uncharacterized protein n=2 Tax=Coxiella burnetii TaxID=777 RepID=Q83C73_COXBU|nr:hypothetical protein [Coxiella burnetii]NP_820250.1 hypothetical protein CBU_1256 [Coxiella burnetii RSA 493]AAO90764.1 hypothetical protein CBU_1256 [Coxiella burnetii RSA 493]ABS78413.1 hypothetical protein CBUD_1340 [Coxiella burnetii Dugway 5J108-111]ABX77815.1 hypothetical protein COXBURSA331_A1401 [Coxiella burnetii RSA 331]ACJ18153.1 hypothetical protein CbuG_0756 [Coxiella burnetii CbuG_Q212]ACJ20310.1 hypothetical protein CbuK_1115 [Coxiella burnetii CbuK_Q154]
MFQSTIESVRILNLVLLSPQGSWGRPALILNQKENINE